MKIYLIFMFTELEEDEFATVVKSLLDTYQVEGSDNPVADIVLEIITENKDKYPAYVDELKQTLGENSALTQRISDSIKSI